ncbi:19985_t:CDS:2 [Gigaspora rosea]|nr:19985_t:CDS:2 [Gigaspora rosea]
MSLSETKRRTYVSGKMACVNENQNYNKNQKSQNLIKKKCRAVIFLSILIQTGAPANRDYADFYNGFYDPQ